jgi:AraC-like DNA-binding protein
MIYALLAADGISWALINNHTIPLVDVAYLVGYEDQSYFSKVSETRQEPVPASSGNAKASRGRRNNIDTVENFCLQV